MLFNSLEFFLFLALCYSAYLLVGHRAQNVLLLVASYAFYAAWDYRFLSLLWLSTVIDFQIGRRLAATSDRRTRKLLVGASIAANLGILGVFKYLGFLVESFHDMATMFGLDIPVPVLQVVLPVGISFYTFQTLSYTIDIYRERLKPTRGFVDFALFVAFFPQLVAGPIERAVNLLPQIVRPRRVSMEGLGSGSWLILWGIFKKVVIADNLAAMVDAVYSTGSSPTGPEILLATYAFAFQIYCDFSGYTDVARGVARLFGFELMLNFNIPYVATNPSDFWQRWHISLSSWLRDYLYISLGGNRRGRWKTYRNLALTMVLGGLWHGAAWTFVAWGSFHGLLLIVHRWMEPLLARVRPGGVVGAALWRSVRVVFFFHLVCFSWMIFRADSLMQVRDLLGTMVRDLNIGLAATWARPLAILVLPLLAMQTWQLIRGKTEPLVDSPLLVRATVYLLALAGIVLLGEDFGQVFIYFQF